MKYTFLLLLVCSVGFTSSCSKSEPPVYSNIETLFKAFPEKLKSDTWEDLENFVAAIVPDESTFGYMKKNAFSYRGIPESTAKTPFLAEYIRTFYLNNLLRFRVSLEQKNLLKDLRYVKMEREGTEIYDEKLGIEATETFIVLASGKETFRCKLGEMFKINGGWKSFTEPKLGW